MTPLNNGQEGAASAAPFTPEEAERQLGVATTPEQAWLIYELAGDREEGWRVIKLKAERKYGELLGEATTGGQREGHVTGGHVAPENRKQAERARKVWKVPQEKFDAYIAEHGTKSTRAGLLRAVNPPRERKRSEDTSPLEAVKRLRQRVKQVRSLSADVRPRWTLEDVADVETAYQIPTGRKSGATARMRKYATARKKDPGKLWDLRYNLMKIVGWLAQLDLLDWGIEQWERGGIYDLYDDLVLLDEWTTRALARASTYIDDDGLREKIRKMEENQSGRTDAEKENIKRRVKALKQRLEAKAQIAA